MGIAAVERPKRVMLSSSVEVRITALQMIVDERPLNLDQVSRTWAGFVCYGVLERWPIKSKLGA